MPKYAIPEKKKYKIDTAGRAKNAIARVQQYGSPSEKRRVYSAVRRYWPAIARRSRVIPTRSGSGRRYGQSPTKAGGSSVAGTVRRRRGKGGGKVATRKQIAAAKRNIKKAQAARRKRAVGRRAGGRRRR